MYRKLVYLVIFVFVLAISGVAQAGLFDPPLKNPSFESPVLTGWDYYSDDWILNAEGAAYLENGGWFPSSDGINVWKLWSDANLWQQIGTWDPGIDYAISLWVGRALTDSTLRVELWAGGNPSLYPTGYYGQIEDTVGATLIAEADLIPTVEVGQSEWMTAIINTGASFNAGDALWLRIVSTAPGGSYTYVDLVEVSALMDPALAYSPSPPHEATDVPRDVVIGWLPGIYANKHDVYFGTVFEDVGSADRSDPRGVLVGQGQSPATYEPDDRLDFGRTYYWRIDELNAPPDSTIFKSTVWSFTVEPFAYPIAGENVTATASSQTENQGPENTVNASGLDVNNLDLHSTDLTDMWLSAPAGQQPTWIQYEFDKAYKLHEMWVWNHNGLMEPMMGIGFKDVSIEYSVNGTDYTTLGTTHEFAPGTGAAGYEHNTTVDFGGASAKFVRLTANSNWVGFLVQYGLSEVRFLYIPIQAREPSPDSGATDVDVDVTLGFRAGREAAKHDVYLSTDEQAVIDGTAPVNTVTEASYSTPLDLGSTYYWRVDEVNDAETPTTWQGEIWNFTTPEYLVVDDFELYNDLDPGDPGSNRIFNTWIDGYGITTNGSIVGYDVPPFAEQDIVHGGSQSMPLFYDNTSASLSEVTANTNDLPIGSNWSIGSPQALVLWIYGDPGNAATDHLYMKIGSSKVIYDGDIVRAQWTQWTIDLAALGVNLNNVSTVTIGLERTGGSGGSGVIFLDDIRLYGTAPAVSFPPDPEENLTVNPSFESPDLGPGGTEQWADYVDNWIIGNQGGCYLEDGTWQVVAPDGAASLKMWEGGAIWQQIGNVSPNTDYEISMFIGKGYDDTCAVQVELWAGGDPSALPTSYGVIGDTVGATLIGGAPLVPTVAVGENEWMSLILNTGAGFNSDDALWLRIESTGYAAWVDNVMVTIQ